MTFRQTKQSQTSYRVETFVSGAWQLVETFDSVSRALGRYNTLAGRRRILQSWFDSAQRQHSAVLRDSEQDAAVAQATERKLEPVLDTTSREWHEDADGEPTRVAPTTGVFFHLSGR